MMAFDFNAFIYPDFIWLHTSEKFVCSLCLLFLVVVCKLCLWDMPTKKIWRCEVWWSGRLIYLTSSTDPTTITIMIKYFTPNTVLSNHYVETSSSVAPLQILRLCRQYIFQNVSIHLTIQVAFNNVWADEFVANYYTPYVDSPRALMLNLARPGQIFSTPFWSSINHLTQTGLFVLETVFELRKMCYSLNYFLLLYIYYFCIYKKKILINTNYKWNIIKRSYENYF